jgi:hypothetical protein
MNEIRSAFMASIDVARSVLAAPGIAARWREPSALKGLSVGGLAGHLFRAVGAVGAYLGRPEPETTPVPAARYFVAILGDADLESPLHTSIREKGEQGGAVEHAALLSQFDALCDGLRRRLDAEPSERKLKAFQDIVLTLDDFLVTRVIEVVVHTDDLAASAELDDPPFPNHVVRMAIDAMVGIAQVRHGDLAVVRALSRRERDAVEALRVF